MQNLQCQKHVGVIQLRQIALDSIDFPPLNYLCTVFEKMTQKYQFTMNFDLKYVEKLL